MEGKTCASLFGPNQDLGKIPANLHLKVDGMADDQHA